MLVIAEQGALSALRPILTLISGGHVLLRAEGLGCTDSSGYIQQWVVP